MPTLHIEHAVPDFNAWKRTFDAYADHRARGGVSSYRVTRPVDDPKFAVIDLEFAELEAARKFLAMLQQLWQRVDGTIVHSPRATILETVEQAAV